MAEHGQGCSEYQAASPVRKRTYPMRQSDICLDGVVKRRKQQILTEQSITAALNGTPHDSGYISTTTDCNSLPRSIWNYQAGVPISNRQRAGLHHIFWSSYGQCLPDGPAIRFWTPLEADTARTSLEYDQSGQYLLAGTQQLGLGVFQTSAIMENKHRAACFSPEGLRQYWGDNRPVTRGSDHFLTATRQVSRARWIPGEQHEIALTSFRAASVHLYDLRHCQSEASLTRGNQPYRTLDVKTTGPESSQGRGFSDVVFSEEGLRSLAAAGQSGQIFLWDALAGNLPRTVVNNRCGSPGGIVQLQITPGSRCLIAAKKSGEIQVWDMRKSSSAPSFGASGVRHHNLLGYIDLRRELVKIQELAQETTIPTFQLESLQLDPQDSTRAAFHLSCGWSGVIDLLQGEVTHLHCPSFSSSDSRPNLVCKWTADSSAFCVPFGSRLFALDFSRNAHSPCSVKGNSSTALTTLSAVSIPLDYESYAVATHPDLNELVAGWLQEFFVVSPGYQSVLQDQ